jgi:gamma-glutamyl hercynylcysteine S-oxide synthase
MSKLMLKVEKPLKQILDALVEARCRTLDLVQDLDGERLMGPRLRIINPLLWEIGHVGYFQEFWCLRQFRGLDPVLKGSDQLYDSARVAHDVRWDLPLPGYSETLAHMKQVLHRVLEMNQSETEQTLDGYGQNYFLTLALFHEQMHAEAIAYTRQTLGYSPPRFNISSDPVLLNESGLVHANGDAFVPGSRYIFGNTGQIDFIFDNELTPHALEIKPFSIAKTAVTESEFAAFVDDSGYSRPELWSEAGWSWRENASASHPVYWKREGGGWFKRTFDEWSPINERLPILHVNFFEAEAYCRWAGRRLPSESEWEMAASCEQSSDSSGMTTNKRTYPWGDEFPSSSRSNLDWQAMGCVPVDALAAGDSAFGCRQMIGNCWEWTSSDFGAYPGFKAGPYKEYSEPWFGDHKVLRGGCWVTRSSMITNTYRNFYTPDRRDVWAGFRTCALQTR